MPSSEAFNWSRSESDAPEKTTADLTVGAGEIARVRVSAYDGDGDLWIMITRNGVTSKMTVDASETWATSMVAEGDIVSLKGRVSRNASINGIIELLI